MTDDDRTKPETPKPPVEQEESGAGYGNHVEEDSDNPAAK